MGFTKAVRTKAKLRLALCGPSGSGKSYTALRIAMALAGPNGKVAVLDTERGSASLYAGQHDEDDNVTFAFDVDEPKDYSPKTFVRSIREAAEAGYDVLILDSITHAWDGVKAEADKGAARKNGNTWAGWSDARPLEKEMLDAMLQFPGHVIATMRVKTVWETVEGKGGKKAPQKVGLAPEQKQGIEYEFTVTMDLDTDHQGVVTKSRCSAVADAVISRPGAPFAKVLLAWLDGGADAPAPVKPERQAVASNGRTPQKDLRAACWGWYKIDAARKDNVALFDAFCFQVAGGRQPKDLNDEAAQETLDWFGGVSEDERAYLLHKAGEVLAAQEPPQEPARAAEPEPAPTPPPKEPEPAPPPAQEPPKAAPVPVSVLQNNLTNRLKAFQIPNEKKPAVMTRLIGTAKWSDLNPASAGVAYASLRGMSDQALKAIVTEAIR